MEEKEFKKYMQQTKLEIQFSDFDNQLMEKIKARETSRKAVWKNLRISWFFFFVGTFFGIIVAYFLTDLSIPFLEAESKLVLLIVEILIVVVVTSQFDKLIHFTFKKRE